MVAFVFRLLTCAVCKRLLSITSTIDYNPLKFGVVRTQQKTCTTPKEACSHPARGEEPDMLDLTSLQLFAYFFAGWCGRHRQQPRWARAAASCARNYPPHTIFAAAAAKSWRARRHGRGLCHLGRKLANPRGTRLCRLSAAAGRAQGCASQGSTAAAGSAALDCECQRQ